jgi:hypothetical protein
MTMPEMQKDLIMINFFGPPGVGKTKMAADVFSSMKLRHMSVGQAPEYAKDMLMRLPRIGSNEDIATFLTTRQLHIFAEQHLRQQVLEGVFEYGVTDSPLLMSIFYAPKQYYASFASMVKEVFDSYRNINFYLTRDIDATPFEKGGRVHSLEQSRVKDREIRSGLARLDVPFTEIDLDDPQALARVLAIVHATPT